MLVEHTFKPVLQSHCDDKAMQWLLSAIATIENSVGEREPLQIALAMARRKVGDTRLVFSLPGFDGEPLPCEHWVASDLARICLLAVALRTPNTCTAELLTSCFQSGDERERSALLMGLAWLDPAGLWLAEAEQCCRVNSVTQFAAIAMQNPYPAQFFAQHSFNQLVLKSLFLGLDINHVHGLQQRNNAQLSSMCCAYIDEQVAAGRQYPLSIWLAVDGASCEADRLQQAANDLSPEAYRSFMTAS